MEIRSEKMETDLHTDNKKAKREWKIEKKKNENYAYMQFIVITISLPFVFG